ncbi:MAG: zinc ribbon domain-containing protein [Deltaproteobacteria bacterium]|nr:zinc ribbon domain-containing protein [Deltaproteobacteria bacterium]
MPIYEYRCEQCEEEFEVSQRITEDALTEHEGCGGPVKRLISRTSFALKGKGWYSDHYGLQPGAKKEDSSSSAPAPAKSEAKSEAKAESSPSKSESSGAKGGSASDAKPAARKEKPAST